MPQSRKMFELVGLAAAVAWVAGACSGSSSPSALLTTAQAADVSVGVAFDAEAEVSGAAVDGGTTDYTDAPAVGPTSTVPSCTVTRSPTNPDTSVIGTPDSVNVTFTNCVISYAGTSTGGYPETDTLQGTITYVDPDSTVATHVVKRDFVNVERIRDRLSGSTIVRSTETWNGRRWVTQTSDVAFNEADTNFVTTFLLPDGSTPVHTRSWTATWTSDGDAIAPDLALPSGSVSITGQGTWAVGGNTYNMTIVSSGLHYNTTCTAVPRFDGGTMTATLTLNGTTGTVKMTFGPCGVVTGTNS